MSRKAKAAPKSAPAINEPAAPEPSPSRARTSGVAPLLALMLLYAVLTLGLIARVPQGSPPDENEHYEYVTFLANNGKLPFFVRRGGNDPGFEFHQPPLYYALGAVVHRVAPPKSKFYAVRGLSLLCGLGVLALAWSGIGALFPGRRDVRAGAVGLLALSPWHQGLGAGVTNDALAGVVGAAIFWSVARFATRSSPFAPLLLGVLAGAAVLTKATCMLLVPVCLGTAWMLAPAKTSVRVRDLLSCGAVALALCGWWFWRNYALYGDPLALGAISERFAETGSRIQFNPILRSADSLTYARAVGLIFLCTAFGIAGGPNTAERLLTPFEANGPVGLQRLDPFTAFGVLLALMLCALASLAAVLGFARELREAAGWPAPAKRALTWWLIGTLLVVAWLVRFNFEFFQAQARYLQPAIVPLALAFALGWRNLFARRATTFAFAFGAVLVALSVWNIVSWRTLN